MGAVETSCAAMRLPVAGLGLFAFSFAVVHSLEHWVDTTPAEARVGVSTESTLTSRIQRLESQLKERDEKTAVLDEIKEDPAVRSAMHAAVSRTRSCVATSPNGQCKPSNRQDRVDLKESSGEISNTLTLKVLSHSELTNDTQVVLFSNGKLMTFDFSQDDSYELMINSDRYGYAIGDPHPEQKKHNGPITLLDQGNGQWAFQTKQYDDVKYCQDRGTEVKCNEGSICGNKCKFTFEDAGNSQVKIKGGKRDRYCAVSSGSGHIQCNNTNGADASLFSVHAYGKLSSGSSLWEDASTITSLQTIADGYAASWFGSNGPTNSTDLSWCMQATAGEVTKETDYDQSASLQVQINGTAFNVTPVSKASRHGVHSISRPSGGEVLVCSVWSSACLPSGPAIIHFGGKCATARTIVGCKKENNWHRSCVEAYIEVPMA